MAMKELRAALNRFQGALVKRSYYADKDERGIKQQLYNSQIGSNLGLIEKYLWENVQDIPNEKRLELFVLLDKLKKGTDIRMMLLLCSEMEELLAEVKEKGQITFSVTRLPEEVRDELLADLDELKRCYTAGCYRSSVVLCGRILEVALHRKYYETTQLDILEKNPGIGLGTLVKKLIDKEVPFDPGVTQQIHLINNVRVSSVHKKQQPFVPSKAQTHATILFTLDTLQKLFTHQNPH